MARPTSSDLLLTFTIGANTSPTSTEANTIITELFKQAFIKRNLAYTATDSDVLDTEEAYAIIKAAASRIITQWHNSLGPNSQTKSPVLYLSKEEVKEIKELTGKKLHASQPLVETVRVFGFNENWD